MQMMVTPEGAVTVEDDKDEGSMSSNTTPRGSSIVTSWIVRGSMDDSLDTADDNNCLVR